MNGEKISQIVVTLFEWSNKAFYVLTPFIWVTILYQIAPEQNLVIGLIAVAATTYRSWEVMGTIDSKRSNKNG